MFLIHAAVHLGMTCSKLVIHGISMLSRKNFPYKLMHQFGIRIYKVRGWDQIKEALVA